jgi:hypothetical protein
MKITDKCIFSDHCEVKKSPVRNLVQVLFDRPAPVRSYQCQIKGILLYEHYVNCVSEHKSLTVWYWQVLKGRHFNKTVNCFYYNIQLQWWLDCLCRPQNLSSLINEALQILLWNQSNLILENNHVFFTSRYRKYNLFLAILQLL